MEVFDLLGPLPAPRTTTVLEASAGTGKTFALAGLVVRYIAEGVARLQDMLLVTFSRSASQELRERVREALVDALYALDHPTAEASSDLVAFLRTVDDAERDRRRQRLRDALTDFDAATIATTHQFCQLVLRSLGVAGDTDAGVTLVEDLDDLAIETADDCYLKHFGDHTEPTLTRSEAVALAKKVTRDPATELRPRDPAPDSVAAARVAYAADVRAQWQLRKRTLGILGYDDLLSRLADALEADDAPARTRMRERWSIVMVDEFQDTDPVQWDVLRRAFHGEATLVLIGDPKQAIYGFRGGDVVTYLRAAATADERRTLPMNWRSDSALIDRLQVVLQGARLGDDDIVVQTVAAHHQGHRLAGAPAGDPFRLRVVSRDAFGVRGDKTIPAEPMRAHIAADLAADVGALLTAGATFDGRPLAPQDVAVIVNSNKEGRRCCDALIAAGLPAVFTGDSDVVSSPAADDWLILLEAFDQPHRSGLVRAAATTMFFGETAASLAAGGDRLTDDIADTVRRWADHARQRGVAAVLEAAQVAGMGRRVLAWRGGERDMTDLAHLTQLLQDTAHREHLNLPALTTWLRDRRAEHRGATERSRRLDSDAAAVQIMTAWGAKGLQFPVVYLPYAFERWVQSDDVATFHDADARCLYVGGAGGAGHGEARRRATADTAGDIARVAYVALTRAQSQVVAWWAPSYNEPHGGLSRLLRGRDVGAETVPDRCEPPKITDAQALHRLRAWADAGGPTLERSEVAAPAPVAPTVLPDDLAARHFHRRIDPTWRRTSYSGLLRAAEETGGSLVAPGAAGVDSEADVPDLEDESADEPIGVGGPATTASDAGSMPSPMADLPTGATFGSLVHEVLERADPAAADLAAEFRSHAVEAWARWPVEAGAGDIAAALVPAHDTPLGPLAPGATLRDVGRHDRLTELDFELPLGGGRLSAVADLLTEHLPPDDPLAGYAARLGMGALGASRLKGYLTGSIDVVFRLGERHLVVDWKTNRLGDPTMPLTAADYRRDRMVEAMVHHDYPLQALLYQVALHRFLRWRLPGYTPDRHLGGVLYLFVRGMCGPDSPVVDGHPSGVFSWAPPAALVVALSNLLHTGGGDA